MLGSSSFLDLDSSDFFRNDDRNAETVDSENELREMIRGYTGKWGEEDLEEIEKLDCLVSEDMVDCDVEDMRPHKAHEKLDERKYIAKVLDVEINEMPPHHVTVEREPTEVRFWGGDVNSGIVTIEGPGTNFNELHRKDKLGKYSLNVIGSEEDGKEYERAEKGGRGYNIELKPEETCVMIENYNTKVERLLDKLSYKLEI